MLNSQRGDIVGRIEKNLISGSHIDKTFQEKIAGMKCVLILTPEAPSQR